MHLRVTTSGRFPCRLRRRSRCCWSTASPAREPFSGETDFLLAARAPSEDESPQFRVQVIMPQSFDARSLEGVKVAVLANVERITFEQSAAIGEFLDAGGGILVAAPGDRTDATSWHNLDWMPARLGAYQGNTTDAKIIAHPLAVDIQRAADDGVWAGRRALRFGRPASSRIRSSIRPAAARCLPGWIRVIPGWSSELEAGAASWF